MSSGALRTARLVRCIQAIAAAAVRAAAAGPLAGPPPGGADAATWKLRGGGAPSAPSPRASTPRSSAKCTCEFANLQTAQDNLLHAAQGPCWTLLQVPRVDGPAYLFFNTILQPQQALPVINQGDVA